MILVGLSLATGCSTGPLSADTLTYEAQYGDLSLAGPATVSYTEEDGRMVTEQVTMPWTSSPVVIESGRTYRLVVTAAPRADAALNCGMHVDSGWNVGSSANEATCTYAYPDDVSE
jgi:hypothetical protein